MDLSGNLDLAQLFDLVDDLPNIDSTEIVDSMVDNQTDDVDLMLLPNDNLNDKWVWGVSMDACAPDDGTTNQMASLECVRRASSPNTRERCTEFDTRNRCYSFKRSLGCCFKRGFENCTTNKPTQTECCFMRPELLEIRFGHNSYYQSCCFTRRVTIRSSQPCNIRSFMAATDTFTEPHHNALFVPQRTDGMNPDSILVASASAVPELVPASSVVKQVETSSCGTFCESNYYLSSGSAQQSTSLSASNSLSFSTVRSFGNEPSLPQSIHSLPQSHKSFQASLQSQNSAYQFSSSLPAEQGSTVCSGQIVSNKFLDSLIEETREEIRQCKRLEKRPSSNHPDELSPAKRRCVDSEKHCIWDEKACHAEQNDVADQTACSLRNINHNFDFADDDKNSKHLEEYTLINSCSNTSLSTESSAESEYSTSLDSSPCSRRSLTSLAGLSDEEIAERKRQQNRIAAARYRMKIKSNRIADKQEIERLEKRNSFLKINIEMLTKEIKMYKQTILESIRK